MFLELSYILLDIYALKFPMQLIVLLGIYYVKNSQELVLKISVWYFKAARDTGLVLNPTPELKIDFYPDADFYIIYGRNNSTDPACVKSRTGYAITFANFQVFYI